jgi:hypothetical protein
MAFDLQQRLLGVVVAGAVRSDHDRHWPPFATLASLLEAGAAV